MQGEPDPGVQRIEQARINTQVASSRPLMLPNPVVPLEGRIPPADHIRPARIAFLRPEQSGLAKLTAYDFAIYGISPAKLERISADTITHGNVEDFFLILIRTERSYPGTEAGPPEIEPGKTR